RECSPCWELIHLLPDCRAGTDLARIDCVCRNRGLPFDGEAGEALSSVSACIAMQESERVIPSLPRRRGVQNRPHAPTDPRPRGGERTERAGRQGRANPGLAEI